MILFLTKFQLDEHKMVQLLDIYEAFLFSGNEKGSNLFTYIVQHIQSNQSMSCPSSVSVSSKSPESTSSSSLTSSTKWESYMHIYIYVYIYIHTWFAVTSVECAICICFKRAQWTMMCKEQLISTVNDFKFHPNAFV